MLPVEPAHRERGDRVDLYVPDGAGPWPAVVLVHGGPVPSDRRPTPRDWPVYIGYGNALASRGAVGAVVAHRLHDPADYPTAAADVAEAVAAVRSDRRVHSGRIALWFFSGGSLLLADWLRAPPSWLRCVAASYPLLAPLPGWQVDARFRPADAVRHAGDLPIVLTRVGRERPNIAATVEPFVTAASGARLHIIDVPDGQHGFDQLDHTDQSREAVERGLGEVLSYLRTPEV